MLKGVLAQRNTFTLDGCPEQVQTDPMLHQRRVHVETFLDDSLGALTVALGLAWLWDA